MADAIALGPVGLAATYAPFQDAIKSLASEDGAARHGPAGLTQRDPFGSRCWKRWTVLMRLTKELRWEDVHRYLGLTKYGFVPMRLPIRALLVRCLRPRRYVGFGEEMRTGQLCLGLRLKARTQPRPYR